MQDETGDATREDRTSDPLQYDDKNEKIPQLAMTISSAMSEFKVQE